LLKRLGLLMDNPELYCVHCGKLNNDCEYEEESSPRLSSSRVICEFPNSADYLKKRLQLNIIDRADYLLRLENSGITDSWSD
jgi:hypothetical protein